jgi:hypothetical protein
LFDAPQMASYQPFAVRYGTSEVEDEWGNVTAREDQGGNPKRYKGGRGGDMDWKHRDAAAAAVTEKPVIRPQTSIERSEARLAKAGGVERRSHALTDFGIQRHGGTGAVVVKQPAVAAAATSVSRGHTDFRTFIESQHVPMDDDGEEDRGRATFVHAIPLDGETMLMNGDATRSTSVQGLVVSHSRSSVPLAVAEPPETKREVSVDVLSRYMRSLSFWKQLYHQQNRPTALILDALRARDFLIPNLLRTSISEHEFTAIVQKLYVAHKCGTTLSGASSDMLNAVVQRLLRYYSLPEGFDDANAPLLKDATFRGDETRDLRHERVLMCFLNGLMIPRSNSGSHRNPALAPLLTLDDHMPRSFFGYKAKASLQSWYTSVTKWLSSRDQNALRATCRKWLERLSDSARGDQVFLQALVPRGITLHPTVNTLALRCQHAIHVASVDLEQNKTLDRSAVARSLYFYVKGQALPSTEAACVVLTPETALTTTALFVELFGIRCEFEALERSNIIEKLLKLLDTSATGAVCTRLSLDSDQTRVAISATCCAETSYPFLVVSRIGIGRRKLAEAMKYALAPYVIVIDVLRAMAWSYGMLDAKAVTQLIGRECSGSSKGYHPNVSEVVRSRPPAQRLEQYIEGFRSELKQVRESWSWRSFCEQRSDTGLGDAGLGHPWQRRCLNSLFSS